MPVKSKEDEHKWQKAKELAKEQGKPENYAYIMGIYKSMKPDYFKEAAVRVAARWLVRNAAPTPAADDAVVVKTVTMRVDTSDEWAILSIQLTGEWPRPLGGAAEKELAMLLYEKASKLPSWSSALARVPRTIETVDEYATDSRYDYGDGDDDYGEYDDREPVMQETAVPIPRSWRDVDQWDVEKNKATLSLSNRN